MNRRGSRPDGRNTAGLARDFEGTEKHPRVPLLAVLEEPPVPLAQASGEYSPVEPEGKAVTRGQMRSTVT